MINKIALIGDSHFGIKSSSIIAAEYLHKFYSQIFFPYIDKHEIDTIIHLGDLVDHRKHINYITAKYLEQDFMRPLLERNIDLHIICGNHDTFYKHTNQQNAIDQLYPSSIYPIHIYSNPQEVNIKGINFLMLPWIVSDNYDQSMEYLKTSKAEIVISHLELAGFEMDKGNIKHNGMDRSLLDRFPRVYSGHYHHKSSLDNITYLGAPCQYTWIDYDDPKGFHVLDASDKSLTYIKNPFELFKKFIYDDKFKKTPQEMLDFDETLFSGAYTKIIIKNKNDPFLFDMLVNKIESASPADIQIVEGDFDIDMLSMFNDENIDEEENQDTISLLKKYVSSIDSSSNKEKLTEFITSLYVEALNVESN